MPEIAEVGKRIKSVVAIDDNNVFGKAGTTGEQFAASVKGKKVVSAGRQGKYFWLVLDSPPHPVMHFGMTGWIHIKGQRTGYTNYYNKLKAGEADLWPPKFWKFHLETEGTKAAPSVELAFTDPRRFGRVRLVDCPGGRIRTVSPLAENGPDPVVDADTTFTEEYVLATMRKRHVPIKALLLDQAFISGIGNWVGDEVLFHARVHPEQYCDEFDTAQMQRVYASICYVCRTAVDLLGDSDKFPDDWLFRHRWDKGTKGAVAQLPGGEKLAFLTVGGRTSCFAPDLQKKSGAVAPGIKEEPVVIQPEKAASSSKPAKGGQKTTEPKTAPKKETKAKDVKKRDTGVTTATKRKREKDVKEEAEAEMPTPTLPKKTKESKPAKKAEKEAIRSTTSSRTNGAKQVKKEATSGGGRRRSARLSGI
ncbi:formamidopyrimidine-DNA glycosylase [Niveomyces insectorum RCEF 264]|uniref:Formamidopyrimidine-DNA glycosylase n=1 Tax=Niveomyces insectorum RCEF 264 TaxID=1081102 RepID=A0A167TYA6_9HYPO|nr:formamidopyrimidine-DNA glycosylase [Niveomyces insectorum RCEF 264]